VVSWWWSLFVPDHWSVLPTSTSITEAVSSSDISLAASSMLAASDVSVLRHHAAAAVAAEAVEDDDDLVVMSQHQLSLKLQPAPAVDYTNYKKICFKSPAVTLSRTYGSRIRTRTRTCGPRRRTR